ncbi:MAG: trypsin-like serine protease [Candidatus Nanopelagicales bacterium]|nr:trypsin-like serine protease [Candidatus Nanopelagicales bacterium]
MRRLWTLALALLLGIGVTAPAQAAVQSRPAIINGSPSAPGTHGYLAALLDTARYNLKGTFQAQICGGSLTTPTTVVTAAHCVVDQNSGVTSTPASLLIGLGRSSLQDSGMRVVAISAIAVHPGYSIKTGDDDVAVLTLVAPQTDIATIAPAQLTDGVTTEAAGTRVQVAGWGTTSNFGNSFPDVFRTGDLTLLPASACGQGQNTVLSGLTFLAYNAGEANPLTMLCAVGVSPTGTIIDSCRGDSGGPLIAGDGADARLLGIVSWGLNCATRHPGVYTRVTAMADFLKATGALGGSAPPEILVTPLHERLRIQFPARGTNLNATTFTATLAESTAAEPRQCSAAPVGNGLAASCDITGLVNGTEYRVTAVATGTAGVSVPSTVVAATPLAVPDAGRITGVKVTGKRAVFTVARSTGNGAEITATRIACLPLAGGPGRSAKVILKRATLRSLPPASYACAVTARSEVGTARGAETLLTIPG